jgi:hypothetical protein
MGGLVPKTALDRTKEVGGSNPPSSIAAFVLQTAASVDADRRKSSRTVSTSFLNLWH